MERLYILLILIILVLIVFIPIIIWLLTTRSNFTYNRADVDKRLRNKST